MATEESDYATQETEPEEDNVLAVKDDVPEQPEALESPSKIADDDRILLDTRLCQWVFLLKCFNLYRRIFGLDSIFHNQSTEDEQKQETGRIRSAGAATLLGHVTSIPRSILIACRSQYTGPGIQEGIDGTSGQV